MKKAIVTAIVLIAFSLTGNAQLFRIGIKAGPNFANFSGGVDGINYKSRTSFHAGLAAEIKPTPNFSIQPEMLYSSQGPDVNSSNDFNLDYVSVPVMFKYYIIPDLLSLDAGPQFSFVVKDADEALHNKAFDFALAGGVGINITKSLFAQARYTIGLTDVSDDASVKNAVFQVSLGYFIF